MPALAALAMCGPGVPGACAEDQPRAPAASRPPELRDADDLLWLLDDDGSSLDRDSRLALERLRRGKVSTVDQAISAAWRFALAHGGVLAEEGARVIALLRVGMTVPSFADRGDLVWVVRISHASMGVTQELWISSTTGAVLAMLPARPAK